MRSAPVAEVVVAWGLLQLAAVEEEEEDVPGTTPPAALLFGVAGLIGCGPGDWAGVICTEED